MLSQELNDRLTRVGKGTPMGELLRRYWHPVAAVSELDRHPTKAVRLMGEDLVLYRDLGGSYGLLGRQCPHRSADLSYGYVEARGLRCNYHGWLFAEDGHCLAMPYEDRVDPSCRMRKRTRQLAYRVQEKAGMLWAYLGPDPVPLLPDWDPFGWKNGFVQVVTADVPCNWLQCQENSIDPIHFEWMHANWKIRLEGQEGPYSPGHVKIAFDEFAHGFVYRRIREDTDENDPLWTDGRVALYPNAFFLGSHFEWRVPVDDENTLSVTWSFSRVPREQEPFVQERIPHWKGPLVDDDGRWITSHVMNQDFLAWVGQGRIADRSREHLGASDQGIVMYRRQLLADIDAVARGEDPKGVIRDEAGNRAVPLPMTARRLLTEGMTRAELEADPVLGIMAQRYILQYGQPQEVARQYERAMGFEMDRQGFVNDTSNKPNPENAT